MPRFELKTLTSYDDLSLIGELKRVAAIIPEGKLTGVKFDRLSKVKSKTLRRRFGSWNKVLIAGGLEHRFDASTKPWGREELIEQLKSIAQSIGRSDVTAEDLKRFRLTRKPLQRLFGSSKAALEAAGLSLSLSGVRYSDEECYENLLVVWTALGRQPTGNEMNHSPSRVGVKAYKIRWSTWRKALQAFVNRVNQDKPVEVQQTEARDLSFGDDIKHNRTPRNIPLGLRYTVLVRDRFRCAICGRSPATELNINLHVDHFQAWANGGETVLENLRSLCRDCNLGKGAREEVPLE